MTWRCRKCGRSTVFDGQDLEPRKGEDYERHGVLWLKQRVKQGAKRPYTFQCGCDSHHPLVKGGEGAQVTGCGNMFKAWVAVPPPCTKDGEQLVVTAA